MIEVIEVESLNDIYQYREQYINQLSYPQELYFEEEIRKCKCFLINLNLNTIGYFCVNPVKVLYEFYINNDVLVFAQEIFKLLLEKGYFVAAECKSFDNLLMSLCFDLHKKASCTGYLFREFTNTEYLLNGFDNTNFRIAVPKDLESISEISGDFFEDLKESILREEIFVLCINSNILGVGSCKKVWKSKNYYDLGMVVSEIHRNKGIGSFIIKKLKDYCCGSNKVPICGCWYYNYASKKALEKAGFITKHRIVKFDFYEC